MFLISVFQADEWTVWKTAPRCSRDIRSSVCKEAVKSQTARFSYFAILDVVFNTVRWPRVSLCIPVYFLCQADSRWWFIIFRWFCLFGASIWCSGNEQMHSEWGILTQLSSLSTAWPVALFKDDTAQTAHNRKEYRQNIKERVPNSVQWLKRLAGNKKNI